MELSYITYVKYVVQPFRKEFRQYIAKIMFMLSVSLK